MKNKMKNKIKNNRKLFILFSLIKLLRSSKLFPIKGHKKKYPKVIQLPITYKCNSKCIMCNIWKMDNSNEATVEEFSKFMRDDVFKEVESVGINGGEPSLLLNLPDYVEEILTLPKIKSLNIISNGFNQKLLLKSLEEIYKMCCKKGVHFHVSISLDGVGEIHNIVRGRPKAFEKTISTIDEIIVNQSKYCDSYDVGCTVVKQNVDYLVELDVYAKRKNYNIKYRLGIDNKRIESDRIREQYSVLYSSLRQSAKEFFHYQMSQAKNLADKFKYYSIFSWLDSKNPKRMLGCIWKEEGITLDSRGTLYYCAVASNSIGSLREEKGEKIFFNKKNIEYRKNIITNNCDKCIHDYSGPIEFRYIWKFLNHIIKNRFAMKVYEIKARFM